MLAELATLDDADFRRRFAGTPVKRIGRDRFVRNVAYALGNSAVRETAHAGRRKACWKTLHLWCAARQCGRCHVSRPTSSRNASE